MTLYTADSPYQPKGDHNRRVSLGIDPDRFAAAAGISAEQLHDYEGTSPDHDYDPLVAQRVSDTLDAMERDLPNSQTGRSEHAGTHAPVLSGEHARHQRLMETELRSPILEGAPVYDRQNAEIARVAHMHGVGATALAVLRFGGLLGVGAKQVGVPMAQLDFMRDENGHVHAVTALSQEDLEHLPEHHDPKH